MMDPIVVLIRCSNMPINIRDNGLQLSFRFISFSENPINLTSSLTVHASGALDNANIQCAATSTEILRFRILSS